MDDKWLRVIKKYYDFGMTKLKVLKDQKHFKYDGVDVKYMFKPAEQAENLAVVFSACTRPGLGARYNYVRTLDGMNCHRLYILDDFGPDGRGSFYLGTMPEFKEQAAVIALIQKFVREIAPKKVLFCGSCKGGYAALNIGSRFEDAVMIVGEPTYRIATEFKLATDLLHYWMGEVTEKKFEIMDSYLAEQLKKSTDISSQKIFLFYSGKDEYYEPHTKPLLEDIHNSGYLVEEDVAEYGAHAELALYFPDFLKRKVEDICKAQMQS